MRKEAMAENYLIKSLSFRGKNKILAKQMQQYKKGSTIIKKELI